MESSGNDIIDDYLQGVETDPCAYDSYDLEKLDEFLGNEE